MLIAVSGNIGAGKTTLVSRLAEHFGCKAEYEATEDNPYLERFYQDMKRWAFPLQVYFLSHRFRQGLRLRDSKKGIILDRTIYEDAHVFARNLHQSAYMTDTDYQTYLSLYQSMVELIPPPDLLIYLKASPEKLGNRISGRGAKGERAFEQNIPNQYLQDLNQLYESWINHYHHSPVLKLNVDDVDLAKDENFKKLLKNIQNHRDA
jgi:deoxyadenosine/deoxycytidine kinase